MMSSLQYRPGVVEQGGSGSATIAMAALKTIEIAWSPTSPTPNAASEPVFFEIRIPNDLTKRTFAGTDAGDIILCADEADFFEKLNSPDD